MIVENDRGYRRAQSCSRGNERFGDAGSDGTQACGTSAAEAGKGINDAPYRSKEADEGRYRASRGQPGHTFFDAANLVGGGELHADGDGGQAFQFGRMGIAWCAADLALELTVARGVNVRKGGAR